MLGWALKKGFQGATGLRDAPAGEEDTTQFEAPDTPAPVFAVRAFKNAIWGQSAPTEAPPTKTKSNNGRVKTAQNATTSSQEGPAEARSPTKLNSILLTPGTGASRRKRVSFGRDVKAGNNVDSSPLAASSSRNGRSRQKTTLQQALENSRPSKSKAPEPQVEQSAEDDSEEDGEWEDEDICCNHDVTVDLNEPHSESGKYWKAEWSRYREEAKSDIEQLVKYKANAKSFAAMKDTEASQLSQKLKEEQVKVFEMEKKVADMTSKLATSRKYGTDKDNASMAKDLATQTALVSEYREQVKDLESRLKEARSESNSKHQDRQHINTSPQTEKSIFEISRELRMARSELRQLDELRDEVKRLKSTLATSRERTAAAEAQLDIRASARDSSGSRVTKLQQQLREAKDESQHKDAEIKKLKEDYEALKRDAKARTAEAMQVLQRKNATIEELEKKVKDSEATTSSNQPKNLDTAIAEHARITRGLKSDMDRLGLDDAQRDDTVGGGPLTDWTVDIPTFELQVDDKKTQGEEPKNVGRNSAREDTDHLSARRAARRERHRVPHDEHRVTSDILSNRTTESSRRRLRRRQLADACDAVLTDRNHNSTTSRRAASTRTTTSLAEDPLDERFRRPRALSSRITRPVSPGSEEAPGIDLAQDHFSRLGDPVAANVADRSVLANTSRCTLPADRQATARARLEMRKMERRKKFGQDLDKENVRP
ncbi:spindle pole body formation-associated protein-domain-containing protein [Nemania sp. FL0916]|nr:spindle pole body formation-associated protein-domain-containing protein [Nemania sp. FL0916]